MVRPSGGVALRSINKSKVRSVSMVGTSTSVTTWSTAWETRGLLRFRTHAWNRKTKQTLNIRKSQDAHRNNWVKETRWKVDYYKIVTWQMWSCGWSKQWVGRCLLHTRQYGGSRQRAQIPEWVVAIPQFWQEFPWWPKTWLKYLFNRPVYASVLK